MLTELLNLMRKFFDFKKEKIHRIYLFVIFFNTFIQFAYSIRGELGEGLGALQYLLMPIITSLSIFSAFIFVRLMNKDLLYDPDVQDGFYLLGFCATLSSLVASFSHIVWASSEDAAIFSPEKLLPVISQNASALSTTLVGLSLRVYLTYKYFSKNPEFTPYDFSSINRELKRMVKLTNSMNQTYSDLNKSIFSIYNIDEEDEIRFENMKKIAEKTSEFYRNANDYSDKIFEGMQISAQKLEEVNAEFVKAMMSINAYTEDARDSIGEVSDKAEKTSEFYLNANDNINTILGELNKSAKILEDVNARFVNTIISIDTYTGHARDSIVEASDKSVILKEDLAEASNKAASLKTDLQVLGDIDKTSVKANLQTHQFKELDEFLNSLGPSDEEV
nr:hypothetical protein [uncultured Cohaesibacter sp.]